MNTIPFEVLYDASSQGVFRRTRLPDDLTLELDRCLKDLVKTHVLAPRTIEDTRHQISHYWACCDRTGLSRWNLETIQAFFIALSTPRIHYLQRVASGEAELPCHDRPGIGAASLAGYVTAISHTFAWRGLPLPLDDSVFTAWYRQLRVSLREEPNLKDILTYDDFSSGIELALNHQRNRNVGIRDAALLAIGWHAALYPNEIVQLRAGDVSVVDEGVLVRAPARAKAAAATMTISLNEPGGAALQEVISRWYAIHPGDGDRPFVRRFDFNAGQRGCMNARRIGPTIAAYCEIERPDGLSLRRGWIRDAVRRNLPLTHITARARCTTVTLHQYLEAHRESA